MRHDPASDPRGHRLLTERLDALPGILRSVAAAPLPVLSPRTHASRHFVIVGTGSSEAHGRFLEHLLNHATRSPAEFVPLSGFLRSSIEERRGKTLVVFSQGLSPNARTAFARRKEFDHTVVFTACTPEGCRASGKLDKLAFLEELRAEGAEIVTFPIEDEYTTLIRIIGPVCAYLACWRFAASLGGSRLGAPDAGTIETALAAQPPASLVEDFSRHTADFRRGFYMVAGSPLSEFAQDLCYKFMEGLFWSAPVVWDFLQFAHGPFQEVSLNPRPVLLLQTPAIGEAELCERTERMLANVGLKAITVPLATEGFASILEAEFVITRLVLNLIREQGIDQVDWPSKGKDDPLYGFYRQ